MQYIDEYVNRANGLTKPTYIVPELEDILKPTFGIAIYQESIMQITQALGGYSAGQADSFRKAIGKKSKEVMDKELPKLYQSIIDNGYSEEVAKAVNDIIEPFIGYGFNKSHAAAYSYIAYQTAYLKTYYPLEFFIANLTIEQNDKDEVALLIQDAERNGIKVIPPDVNLSKESFSRVNDNTIVYGLGGIKSLKEKSIETIINTRPYENFYDFISKIEGNYLDKASLTALAFSGGFDNLEGFQEYNRAEINSIFMKHKNVKESEEDIELLETFNHFKKLELEKFYLGIYLSGHPLEGIAQPLNWEEINSNEDTYNTLCIVNNVKPIITKKGDSMAFITLSLIDRELEVVCFPNTWEKSLQLRKGSPYIPYNQIIKEGLIVRAKGKAEYNKSSMSYFLNDISIPLRHNKHLEHFLLRIEAEYGIPVIEKEVIQMPVFNIDELF